MARTVAPRGGGSGDAAAWLIPAVAGVLFVGGGALWAGGGLASELAGAGFRSVPFRLATLIAVIRSGPRSVWPAADPRTVALLTTALLVVVAGPVLFVVSRAVARRAPADDPRRSLARGRHLETMLRRPVSLRAQRLRPSLAGTRLGELEPVEVGLRLGRLGDRGPELFASFEDVVLAVMAPRSGKTTALSIPPVLAFPGPVVATSNKPDTWAATAALREQRTGQRVWTFDPQRVAHARQTWWWNPLRGLDSVEDAERLASHFVLTVEDDRSRDIWGPAAQELLAALLLAAAVSGGDVLDVYRWLSDEATPVPVGELAAHGFDLLARALRGTQDSPPETRGSVYFTARTATKCLRNPAITAWVTPPTGPLDQLDPAQFPRTRQTLYLLSKDGGGSAAPLVAALTDAVLRAGVTAAERAGGRLDPPLLLNLDEAANVCKIADLPQLYSHLGSRGILPLTILQSYRQGVGVWGENGMQALWGAATVKVIGPGMDDADFAEDISRLVGDHDVTVESRNTGDGRVSRTVSTRQQRVLPASAIRELRKGHALLLATGIRAALVTLLPWYDGPDRAEVDASIHAAGEAIRTGAAR